MEKFMIVSDLDGTLLDSKQRISVENEKWIRHFISSGGLFTFATGRMNESILQYVDQLGIELPVISYNGAKIFCPVTRSTIREEEMYVPKQLHRQLRKYGERGGLFTFKGDALFVFEKNEWTDAFEKKEQIRCSLADEGLLDSAITKMLYIAPDEALLDSMQDLVRQSGFSCRTVFSESDYLEILPVDATKGEGLRRLIEHLGNVDAWTIGVGDYLNDLPLLREVHFGVAVAQAHPTVKAAADIVLPCTNDEHAIARVIQSIMEEQPFAAIGDRSGRSWILH